MGNSKNSTSSVEFDEGSMWIPSVQVAFKDTPNVLTKIEEFKKFKEQNPLASFGTNDKSMVSAGAYAKAMPKARKAHLTDDISIIYELTGRDPIVIKLYGVFTHNALGTQRPGNINIQKNMAKKLARSFTAEEIEYFVNILL